MGRWGETAETVRHGCEQGQCPCHCWEALEPYRMHFSGPGWWSSWLSGRWGTRDNLT
jgi:hypothetical protein